MKHLFKRPSFAQTPGAGPLGSLTATFSAGTLVQALGAVTGLVVIPVLVATLGTSRYGVLTVIVSLAPWLSIMDAALNPATRLLVGESRRGERLTAPRSLLTSASRVAYAVVASNLALLALGLLVLPMVAIFGASGVVDKGELSWAIALFALPVILSTPGAVHMGALEGVGRTVAATVLAGLGPIIALPATLAVAWSGGGLVPLCLVQGFSVALPRFIAWFYWQLRPSLASLHEVDPNVTLKARLVLRMALLSLAVVVHSGVDPLIIAAMLGAEPAASYGLAIRLINGALIPLLVLSPLFIVNLAAARGSGWTTQSTIELRRLVVQSAAVGTGLGGIILVAGPWFATLLSGGDVDAPIGLYAAGACFVATSYVFAPLYMAFSGPRGIRRSVQVNSILVLINVLLSVALVRPLGPAGPLWASVIATLVACIHWIVMGRLHPEWLAETHPPASSDAK